MTFVARTLTLTDTEERVLRQALSEHGDWSTRRFDDPERVAWESLKVKLGLKGDVRRGV